MKAYTNDILMRNIECGFFMILISIIHLRLNYQQNKILAVIDNNTVKEPSFEIELIGKKENEISSIIDEM